MVASILHSLLDIFYTLPEYFLKQKLLFFPPLFKPFDRFPLLVDEAKSLSTKNIADHLAYFVSSHNISFSSKDSHTDFSSYSLYTSSALCHGAFAHTTLPWLKYFLLCNLHIPLLLFPNVTCFSPYFITQYNHSFWETYKNHSVWLLCK